MSWVAVAIGGATLVGGMISSNAASKAASGATNAATAASQLQYNQWLQQQANQKPWLDAGTNAVNQMGAGMNPGGQFTQSFDASKFQADPGYQFRLEQGQKALERAGAARGMSLSGSQLKGLTDYGQGMGSQEYSAAYNRWNNDQNTQWNRLSGLAGTGQQANSQLGQIGMNTANQIGSNMMGAATVGANAGMANAGNWTGILNNGMNQWQQYNMMQNAQNGGSNAGYNWNQFGTGTASNGSGVAPTIWG